MRDSGRQRGGYGNLSKSSWKTCTSGKPCTASSCTSSMGICCTGTTKRGQSVITHDVRPTTTTKTTWSPLKATSLLWPTTKHLQWNLLKGTSLLKHVLSKDSLFFNRYKRDQNKNLWMRGLFWNALLISFSIKYAAHVSNKLGDYTIENSVNLDVSTVISNKGTPKDISLFSK